MFSVCGIDACPFMSVNTHTSCEVMAVAIFLEWMQSHVHVSLHDREQELEAFTEAKCSERCFNKGVNSTSQTVPFWRVLTVCKAGTPSTQIG